ncbi:fkbp-type peptidyl-prolyl cis-trans isomerase, partial [mine drainage metagenome]
LVRVPKKYFAHAGQLRSGMLVPLALKDGGQEWVTVTKVGMTTVDVDRNPPMAGKTLDFEVEILAVREASAAEVAHRHAHGAEDGA